MYSINCMLSPIFRVFLMIFPVVKMKLSWLKNEILIWKPLFRHRRAEFLILIFEIELNANAIIHWNCIRVWNTSVVLNEFIIISDHVFLIVVNFSIEIDWRLVTMIKINSIKTCYSFTPFLQWVCLLLLLLSLLLMCNFGLLI